MILFNGIDNQIHQTQSAGKRIAVEIGRPHRDIANCAFKTRTEIITSTAVEAQAAARQIYIGPLAQNTESSLISSIWACGVWASMPLN